MPELPEVETIRVGLASHVLGQQIVLVRGKGSRLVRNNPQGMQDLHAHLLHARIRGVQRRGKFMWMELDGSDFALVIHLGMSGQVRVTEEKTQELERHEHVRLLLDNGKSVSFVDPRTFGHLTISALTPDSSGRIIPEIMGSLAPDPFEDVAPSVFTTAMAKTSRIVKSVLLDQHVVSGIGNIYADEALFRAGLHGSVRAKDLNPDQAVALIGAAKEVMGEALEVGGTSFDALYVNTEGDPGYFERSLRVYGREGEECVECGREIERQILGGRSHFFCSGCQVLPPV